MFFLKEAVLEVLYEVRDEGRIQPLAIRRRLGLNRADEPGVSANTLIYGILYYLETEGYVEAETGEGWKLTDEAAALFDAARSEDVSEMN